MAEYNIDETGYDDEGNIGGSAAALIRGDKAQSQTPSAPQAPSTPLTLGQPKPTPAPSAPQAPSAPVLEPRDPAILNMSPGALEMRQRFLSINEDIAPGGPTMRAQLRDEVAKDSIAKALATGDKTYLDVLPSRMRTPQIEQKFASAKKMMDANVRAQEAHDEWKKKQADKEHEKTVLADFGNKLKAGEDVEPLTFALNRNGDPDSTLHSKLIAMQEMFRVPKDVSRRNVLKHMDALRRFGATQDTAILGYNDLETMMDPDGNPNILARQYIEGLKDITPDDQIKLLATADKLMEAYTQFHGDQSVVDAKAAIKKAFTASFKGVEAKYAGKTGRLTYLETDVQTYFEDTVRRMFREALEANDGTVPSADKHALIRAAEIEAKKMMEDAIKAALGDGTEAVRLQNSDTVNRNRNLQADNVVSEEIQSDGTTVTTLKDGNTLYTTDFDILGNGNTDRVTFDEAGVPVSINGLPVSPQLQQAIIGMADQGVGATPPEAPTSSYEKRILEKQAAPESNVLKDIQKTAQDVYKGIREDIKSRQKNIEETQKVYKREYYVDEYIRSNPELKERMEKARDAFDKASVANNTGMIRDRSLTRKQDNERKKKLREQLKEAQDNYIKLYKEISAQVTDKDLEGKPWTTSNRPFRSGNSFARDPFIK